MEFPTVQGVIELHADILARTEGTPGILNRESIHSAIDRCQWGPFASAPTLQDRAALLLRGICQDHPFADGNKRTAFAATDAYLVKNGSGIDQRADVVSFMLEVAQGRVGLEDIAAWLVRNQTKD